MDISKNKRTFLNLRTFVINWNVSIVHPIAKIKRETVFSSLNCYKCSFMSQCLKFLKCFKCFKCFEQFGQIVTNVHPCHNVSNVSNVSNVYVSNVSYIFGSLNKRSSASSISSFSKFSIGAGYSLFLNDKIALSPSLTYFYIQSDHSYDYSIYS